MQFLAELGHGGTAQGESQSRLMEGECTLIVFLILSAWPGADSPKEHMVTGWTHGCALVQRDNTWHGFGATHQNSMYMVWLPAGPQHEGV